MNAASVRISVLGPVEVWVADLWRPVVGSRLKLLVRLIVAEGAPVSNVRLLHDLWGDSAGPNVVKTTANRLRTDLGEAGRIVRSLDGGYCIAVNDVAVDAWVFAALVSDAFVATSLSGSLDALSSAERLWRGEPFGQVGAEPSLQAELQRLRLLHEVAVETRYEALLAIGEHRSVVGDLARLVKQHPYREGLVESFAIALYRSGRHREALQVVQDLHRNLRNDLGIEPSSASRSLEHKILAHDASLTASVTSERGVDVDKAEWIDSSLRSVAKLVEIEALGEAARLGGRVVEASRKVAGTKQLVRALCAAARVASCNKDGQSAWKMLEEAQSLARSHQHAESLASVAIAKFALGAGFGAEGQLVGEIFEALALLPSDSPLCVDLYSAAIQHLVISGDSPDVDAMAIEIGRVQQGVQGARQRLLASLTQVFYAGSRNRSADWELNASQAAMSIVADDPVLTFAAMCSLLRARCRAGDIDAIAGSLADLDCAARRALSPVGIVRSKIVALGVRLAKGQFDDIEADIEAVGALGRTMGVLSTDGSTRILSLTAWLELRRFDHIRSFTSSARLADPRPVLWDAIDAYIDGLDDGAIAARPPVASWLDHPELRGWAKLVAAMFIAEAACSRNDVEVALAGAATLEPHAGQFAVVGHSTALLGPVDRVLALCFSLAGRHDAAVSSARSALQQARIGGASLWTSHCQLALAEVLSCQGTNQALAEVAVLVAAVGDGAPVSPLVSWKLARLGGSVAALSVTAV